MSTKKKASGISKPNLPPHHPEALALKADAMPWKTTARNFAVEEYIDAIRKLQSRGYSYAQIAAWLNEQLAEKLQGQKIQRGQVYRVYQQWLELQDHMNESRTVTHLSDEDANLKAELSDKNARKKKTKEPS